MTIVLHRLFCSSLSHSKVPHGRAHIFYTRSSYFAPRPTMPTMLVMHVNYALASCKQFKPYPSCRLNSIQVSVFQSLRLKQMR